MMGLTEQFLSFILSFFFGIFIYIIFKYNKKYLYDKNIIKRFLFATIFFVDIVLLYFLLMKNINGGVINLYFIMFVLLGIVYKKYVKKATRK